MPLQSMFRLYVQFPGDAGLLGKTHSGTFVITEGAVSDLEEIWLYTLENWSLEQADRYYNLIFDEINFICKNSDAVKTMAHFRINKPNILMAYEEIWLTIKIPSE